MPTRTRRSVSRSQNSCHGSLLATVGAEPQAEAVQQCWTALLETTMDGALCIRRGEETLLIRRAAGCLLEPVVGDTVLCFGAGADRIWVLSVLERSSGGEERVLRCDGDTRLVVGGGGQLSLEAGNLQMKSNHLTLQAEAAQISVGSTDFVGERMRVVASTFKFVGSVMSTVMDRVNHFSRHYLRTTEGLDRVSAAHVECEATELLHLRGDHALINGAKLVKTRGAQIHFG